MPETFPRLSPFLPYNDMSNNKDFLMSQNTALSYLAALKKLFLIENMESWNPNLRSDVRTITSETRYFVDPSIAAASLEIGPGDLMNDLHTFGLLFENMVIRDLRVYADAEDGKVYRYRDKVGLKSTPSSISSMANTVLWRLS